MQPLYPPPKARAGIACALNDSLPESSLTSHLLGSNDSSRRPAAPWNLSPSPCLTAASRQVVLRLDSSTGAGMRLTCKFINISEPLGTLYTSQYLVSMNPGGGAGPGAGVGSLLTLQPRISVSTRVRRSCALAAPARRKASSQVPSRYGISVRRMSSAEGASGPGKAA